MLGKYIITGLKTLDTTISYVDGLNITGYTDTEQTDVDLDLLVHLWEDVADVVPGVAVQALLQPLLVEEVSDEADAPPQHEHPVQGARLDVGLRLILGEEPTAKKKLGGEETKIFIKS